MGNLDEHQWRRVQALSDFGQSLSALTFFMEIPAQTSRVERKRYRCYYDAAIISYCRPFTKSNGLPILARKSVYKDASPEEKGLHTFLMSERNKVVAHTDVDRMRLLLTSFEVIDGIRFPQMVEDEEFALVGMELLFETWLRKLTGSLAKEVFRLMQEHEPDVGFVTSTPAFHLQEDSEPARTRITSSITARRCRSLRHGPRVGSTLE